MLELEDLDPFGKTPRHSIIYTFTLMSDYYSEILLLRGRAGVCGVGVPVKSEAVTDFEAPNKNAYSF